MQDIVLHESGGESAKVSTICFRATMPLRAAADAEARRTERTLGWVCRKALERYLAATSATIRLDAGGVAG